MKIEKIQVGTGLTVNLGNYESARLDVSIEASISEDDVKEEAVAELWSFCESEINAKLERIRSKQGV